MKKKILMIIMVLSFGAICLGIRILVPYYPIEHIGQESSLLQEFGGTGFLIYLAGFIVFALSLWIFLGLWDNFE